MKPIQTDRLELRPFEPADAPFVLQLVNEPAFVHFIGDKHVRTPADAERYLRDGPLASYARHGFGLLHVALRDGGTPIGMCGLLQRDTLEAPDLGFALVPAAEGQGLACEAARAVLERAAADGIGSVLAITTQDNARSIRLLERLGMQRDGTTLAPDGATLLRFRMSLEA